MNNFIIFKIILVVLMFLGLVSLDIVLHATLLKGIEDQMVRMGITTGINFCIIFPGIEYVLNLKES